MRFSVLPANTLPPGDLVSLAVAAEEIGYHRFLMSEHFLPMDTASRDRIADCWTVLAGAAVRTSTIELGSLVTPVRYHRLPVLANAVASVDELSGGRVTVGLGAGWQANEHAALELDVGTIGARAAELERACRSLRALLDGSGAPAHQPLDPYPTGRRIPILIGGSGRRSTLPVAAALAQQWNTWSSPDGYGDLARRWTAACAAAGRQPDDALRSTQFLVDLPGVPDFSAVPAPLAAALPTLRGDADDVHEAVARLTVLGCDEFVLPLFTAGDVAAAVRDMVVFAEVVSVQPTGRPERTMGKV